MVGKLVNHLFLWAIYTMAMLVITRGYTIWYKRTGKTGRSELSGPGKMMVGNITCTGTRNTGSQRPTHATAGSRAWCAVAVPVGDIKCATDKPPKALSIPGSSDPLCGIFQQNNDVGNGSRGSFSPKWDGFRSKQWANFVGQLAIGTPFLSHSYLISFKVDKWGTWSQKTSTPVPIRNPLGPTRALQICEGSILIPDVSMTHRTDASNPKKIRTPPAVRKAICTLSGLPWEAVDSLLNALPQLTSAGRHPGHGRKHGEAQCKCRPANRPLGAAEVGLLAPQESFCHPWKRNESIQKTGPRSIRIQWIAATSGTNLSFSRLHLAAIPRHGVRKGSMVCLSALSGWLRSKAGCVETGSIPKQEFPGEKNWIYRWN